MIRTNLNSISEISLNESLNNDWTQVPVTLTPAQTKILLKALKHSVLFDSGAEPSRGQFDILSGEPLSIRRLNKSHHSKNDTEYLPIDSRPFNRACLKIPESYRNLPFVCGLIGFCSYEFGAKNIIKNPKILHSSNLPSAFFAHYTWSYVYDREKKQGLVTFSPECTITVRRKVLALINRCALTTATLKPKQAIQPLWHKVQDFKDYSDSFKKTLNYIQQGDCYQVNLTQRFECDFNSDPCDLYFDLRQDLNTPYSAYFSFLADQHILCFSPEQFIGIKDKKIKTRPIKGTAKNFGNAVTEKEAESEGARALQSSLKNQAENLMIVDLMRNDLSKVCQLNSVKVNELFKLTSFKNVHHLISEIEGKLKAEINEIEAFFSCFPGGSITGAPKKRAMEIINELEDSGRDAYCGSIFYWNDDGQFDSNILIRSIVHSENKLYCWGGGGIVNDSTVEAEYKESLIKVANLTGIES